MRKNYKEGLEAAGYAVLDRREVMILQYMADGLTNKEIARKLRLRPSYIKGLISGTYENKKNIKQKLGNKSRLWAGVLAWLLNITN